MEQVSFDEFTHARVIIGIVTGLSMTRLLTGVARIIQRPAGQTMLGVHLGWALFLLLQVTHFWWFEFGAAPAARWDYALYMFTIFYAALFFFTCVTLFPDPGGEWTSFAGYFEARRAWFYFLLVSLIATDVAFASIKADAAAMELGRPYLMRQGGLAALALAAALAGRPGFDLAVAATAVLLQVWWLLRGFGLAP